MIRRLLIVSAIALLPPAPAAADQVEITSQAKAAKADFLLRATPPTAAAAICLVDTGVNNNPDTSRVLAHTSVDGGAVVDTSPSLHGTQMAMFIGAPSNGYGMVGLWPSARIVSVRANVPGQDAFIAAGYVYGLRQCQKDAEQYATKVVLLAFSSQSQLSPEESDALATEVTTARSHGISVVAAAGNTAGAPVGTPANVSGALSIGATSTGTGNLCDFSATGALLFAPGCVLDGADPATGQPTTGQQGTSHGAAIVAASLAALRTWRPDLTPDDADRLLNDTAAAFPGGRRLDLTAAFTAAGLGAITQPLPPPAPLPPPLPPASKQRMPKPKLTIRSRGSGKKRVMTVKASNRPRGARVTIRVYVRGHGGKLRRVAARTRSSSTVRIRVRSWRRVTAGFTDPSGQRLPGPFAVVNARR
jgi:membrane-anchored mycosin MYCP